LVFDKLLLKTISARLVEPGDCPYDPHCIHAGHGGCIATKDELQEKEAAIKAEAGKGEPLPNIVYVLMDTDKRWPCLQSQTYVILLPDLEGDAEGA
jgi:hypothetical protein